MRLVESVTVSSRFLTLTTIWLTGSWGSIADPHVTDCGFSVFAAHPGPGSMISVSVTVRADAVSRDGEVVHLIQASFVGERAIAAHVDLAGRGHRRGRAQEHHDHRRECGESESEGPTGRRKRGRSLLAAKYFASAGLA